MSRFYSENKLFNQENNICAANYFNFLIKEITLESINYNSCIKNLKILYLSILLLNDVYFFLI